MRLPLSNPDEIGRAGAHKNSIRKEGLRYKAFVYDGYSRAIFLPQARRSSKKKGWPARQDSNLRPSLRGGFDYTEKPLSGSVATSVERILPFQI
jgi:hypothetical protein